MPAAPATHPVSIDQSSRISAGNSAVRTTLGVVPLQQADDVQPQLPPAAPADLAVVPQFFRTAFRISSGDALSVA